MWQYYCSPMLRIRDRPHEAIVKPYGTISQTTYIRPNLHRRDLGIAQVSWRLSNLRRFDFNWYREQFPNLVTRDQVICYKCHSADIGVERKFQQTHARSHICRRCGTTLYYSQEQ